jgi:tol-pal system protein YbgF
MLRLRYLVMSVCLLSTVAVSAADADVARLERELNARNNAMLDMLNRLNEYEQNLRALTGQIDDLNIKVRSLEEQNKALTTELNNIKTQAKTADLDANATNPKTAVNNEANVAPNNAQNANIANDANVQKQYDEAVKLVLSNDFAAAEVKFSDFIAKNPDSQLVPNAYYWLGQMNYQAKKYQKARENFLNVSKYKTSNKRAESIYKIGQIYEALNDKAKAKKFYQAVIQGYPGQTPAVLAQQALDKLM